MPFAVFIKSKSKKAKVLIDFCFFYFLKGKLCYNELYFDIEIRLFGVKEMKQLETYITSIPNYPKEGIIFRDLTSLVEDRDGFKLAIDEMAEVLSGMDCDVICGIESRGFVFGAPLAYLLNKPFVMARKAGKLPRERISESYALEYGVSELEMHLDSLRPEEKVIIIDDLLATGGTAKACARLIERIGGRVEGFVFLSELDGLEGRNILKNYRVESIIHFED